jgi:hypothetical protein
LAGAHETFFGRRDERVAEEPLSDPRHGRATRRHVEQLGHPARIFRAGGIDRHRLGRRVTFAELQSDLSHEVSCA